MAHRFARRLLPAITAGGGLAALTMRSVVRAEQQEKVFTAEEVADRDGLEGRPMWVSYRGGVHDVTEFAKEHPGGKFIEQGAGGDVEGFWRHWHYHFHSPKVTDALRRILVTGPSRDVTEIATRILGDNA